MKRWWVGIGVGVAIAVGVAAPSASAQEPGVSYRPLVQGSNVIRSCRLSNNVVVADFGPFEEQLDTGSLTACISTLQGQELSLAAYNNNCRTLEREVFGPQNGGDPYPYAFYGNPNYVANNRLDCIRLLRGFHTGQLTPGPG